MKASLIFASVLVLATWTANGALAAGWTIGTAPGTTEADCINSGGTVSTDSEGNKICKPRPVKQSAPVGREPTN